MIRRLWLAVLVLALVAPAALASVPRSGAALGAPDLAPLSLERALATGDVVDSSSGFVLFRGDELRPQPLTVFEPSYPETRVRVFDFLGTPLVGVSSGVSHELHWGCGDFGCGFSEGVGNWLSEDPAGDIDSPNKYAYVGWRPNEATDPTGTIALADNAIGGGVSVAIGFGITCLTHDEGCAGYSWKDAGIDFGLGFTTSGLSSLGKLRHLGRVARWGLRTGAEAGLNVGSEIARREWKGEDYSLGELAVGAGINAVIGEGGSYLGGRIGQFGRWASSRLDVNPSRLAQVLSTDIRDLLPRRRLIPGTPGQVTGGSSRVLGGALLSEMGLPPNTPWSPYQAHHLVMGELRAHPVLQAIGMDLDVAANGRFLRIPDELSISPLSRHRGYHALYSQFVRNQLDALSLQAPVRKLERHVFELQGGLRELLGTGLPMYQSQGATLVLWQRELRRIRGW
ncbi:MAG: AHH domain-containing protein [Holophagales bacterium]|nr:AHH domain-containing protein [Holophagales bacterium]